MAGTRTNALVAAGAAAFVMAGLQLSGDSSASRAIGSVCCLRRGLPRSRGHLQGRRQRAGTHTAATIWWSAAIGVLSGLGYVVLAVVLAAAVLLTNIALRPLAYRLHPALPSPDSADTLYEIVLTCRSVDETHLRTLLLATIGQASAILQAIHSKDEATGDRTRLRAEVTTHGRRNDEVERIAMRLSMEPGITSLSWSIVPTAME